MSELAAGLPREQGAQRKDFTHEVWQKFCKLFVVGVVINGVGSTCLHVEVFFYSNHPLLIALFYPSVHSLSSDNAMESERKKNSLKMQPRKVKIKKPRGAPFLETSLGATGKYPLLPPTSRWAWLAASTVETVEDCCCIGDS